MTTAARASISSAAIRMGSDGHASTDPASRPIVASFTRAQLGRKTLTLRAGNPSIRKREP